jgi:hypothetical protein
VSVIGANDDDRAKNIEKLKREGIKYHYDREERLKKLRRGQDRKRARTLSKRRIRTLLIILVDLFIISLVFYILNKPSNIYLEKNIEGILYELNVTGIKGNKLMIGFTVKNEKAEDVVFFEPVPVKVVILDRDEREFSFQKKLDKNTLLLPQESTSVIFLLDQEALPGSGRLDLYFRSSEAPMFSHNARF